ncbi:MAG: pyridoxamine 5'-phosphate oxidase family protein [Desulfovibrio sp.]|jgi:uncharacterized pyridoxamine 5'-phosphate oxidase family protein|nr:pyridoxamine 5'-phosphate oxidase family protein [Desulfovibrio sp.]
MKAPKITIFLTLAIFFAYASSTFADEQPKIKVEQDMREVYDFIKGCGYYFLATTEGAQPRVRPFGTLVIFEGKMYFQTGKSKNVSKQISRNQKIEICAYDGKEKWIRVQAVAINDDRREAKQFMLDAYPQLKGRYSPDDDNTQVLYLKDATATLYSVSEEAKIIKF